MLARLAALVALSEPSAEFCAHVTEAWRLGLRPERLLGVIIAVAPEVGVPRLIAAGRELMEALRLSADETQAT